MGRTEIDFFLLLKIILQILKVCKKDKLDQIYKQVKEKIGTDLLWVIIKSR